MQGQLSQYAIPKRCLSTSLNIPLSSQAIHPIAIPIIKKFSRDVGVASLVLFNLLLLVWSIRDAQMLSLYQPFMYLKKISCPLLFFRPHNLNSSNCFWESAVPKPLLISAAVGVPASSWHSCIAATKTDAVQNRCWDLVLKSLSFCALFCTSQYNCLSWQWQSIAHWFQLMIS